jgi:hypothetical protein
LVDLSVAIVVHTVAVVDDHRSIEDHCSVELTEMTRVVSAAGESGDRGHDPDPQVHADWPPQGAATSK